MISCMLLLLIVGQMGEMQADKYNIRTLDICLLLISLANIRAGDGDMHSPVDMSRNFASRPSCQVHLVSYLVVLILFVTLDLLKQLRSRLPSLFSGPDLLLVGTVPSKRHTCGRGRDGDTTGKVIESFTFGTNVLADIAGVLCLFYTRLQRLITNMDDMQGFCWVLLTVQMFM